MKKRIPLKTINDCTNALRYVSAAVRENAYDRGKARTSVKIINAAAELHRTCLAMAEMKGQGVAVDSPFIEPMSRSEAAHQRTRLKEYKTVRKVVRAQLSKRAETTVAHFRAEDGHHGIKYREPEASTSRTTRD